MITTSKSLDGVQELTLIANLKTGVVPCTGPVVSYATRLRILLSALFTQRKIETESGRVDFAVVETLRILRFVRWALLENDTQLMLAVSFDGPWEPYIRKIVSEAGPLLDVIFCHCADYDDNSCRNGYEKFSAWVREHQVDIPYIYSSDPDLTVDDVRYLKNYERAQAQGSSAFVMDDVQYPPSTEPLTRLYALFGMRQLYSDAPGDGKYTDRQYFDRVSAQVVAPDFDNINDGLAALQTAATKAGIPLQPNLTETAMFRWFATLRAELQDFETPPPQSLETVRNRSTIQGNILTSYGDKPFMTHGCIALLRFKDAARGAAFLNRIKPLITREATQTPRSGRDVTVNVAVTFEGLKTLGLNDDELALFPKEFQEGLETRAGLLGDIGLNHPERWQLPELNWGNQPVEETVRLSLVDAVLILQTSDNNELGPELLPRLEAELRGIQNQAPGNAAEFEILHVQPTRRFSDMGHLGAKDGVSQPVAHGEDLGAFAKRDVVPVGDMLLGYENEFNELGSVPVDLRENSTFLAIRKMTQEPEMYDLLRERKQLELALGRTESGDNLIDPKQENDFAFAANSDQKCPFFSHVRRANPRAEPPALPTRRIIRRGMSFGPRWEYGGQNAPGERGIMFLAIAASLADQYEVVQRWVNGGNSTNGLSAHPDLIAGTYPENSQRKLQYRTPQGVDVIALPPRPAAVLRWGLYAFLPSISALESLAAYPRKPYVKPNAKVTKTPALPPPPLNGAPMMTARGLTTKARFEDVFRSDTLKECLGEVLTVKHGISEEPEYVTLAAARPLVEAILTDPQTWSVRSYWARMTACKATLYLGMDPEPVALQKGDTYAEEVNTRYASESGLANDFARNVSFFQAFKAARQAALVWFAEQDARHVAMATLLMGQKEEYLPDEVLDLQALAARVIRDVASDVYGIPKTLISDDLDLEWTEPPRPTSALRCPVDLTSVFAHVFPPRPTETIAKDAERRGHDIFDKVAAWLANPENRSPIANSPLIQAVQGAPNQTDSFVARTVIGLLSGFAVPTNGTLVSVLHQLVDTDDLWRLQRLMPELELENIGHEALEQSLAPITARVIAAMIKSPVPALIHRTATKQVQLGGITFQPGAQVAMHLGAAAASGAPDEAWKLLFGDIPTGDKQGRVAVHRCPGQKMAFGTILGTVVALLAQPRLKKVPIDASKLTKYPLYE